MRCPGPGIVSSARLARTFIPRFDPARVEAVFMKGHHSAAYSGFEGTDESGTTLTDWLRQRGVDEVDIVGIATDYCVRATAADAAEAGFPRGCCSS